MKSVMGGNLIASRCDWHRRMWWNNTIMISRSGERLRRGQRTLNSSSPSRAIPESRLRKLDLGIFLLLPLLQDLIDLVAVQVNVNRYSVPLLAHA